MAQCIKIITCINVKVLNLNIVILSQSLRLFDRDVLLI